MLGSRAARDALIMARSSGRRRAIPRRADNPVFGSSRGTPMGVPQANPGHLDLAVLSERLEWLCVQVQPLMGVPDLDQHLRFPVIPASPLRGSDIGRALWDSEQGRAVVDYLLTDPRIAQHHPPVPEFNLVEIRGRVASFALAALSAPEPQNFVRANVGTLFDELLNNPQGTSYWFIRGADIAGDGFPIDPWTTLISATDEAWNTLAARLPDGGLVVVPSDANVVVIVRTHVEREEIPFAASWCTSGPRSLCVARV